MINGLIQWYKRNRRELPFRETKDPYKIWLSEIILQQTRVEQGLEYYKRFVIEYPTVFELANAHFDEVMRLWQGLGYYSRARNLHIAAKTVVEEYNGVFPGSSSELKRLKGVGEYTAAAIASISYNEPVPVIDGNVYRVLSRLYAVDEPIDAGKGKGLFYKLAQENLNMEEPGEHNQALMELGALVCKPKNPGCENCPLSIGCKALKNVEQERFPVKVKKIKKRKRFLYFFIIRCGKSTFIQKRGKGDIWQGLYQFPLYESDNDLSEKSVLMTPILKELSDLTGEKDFKISGNVKHVLTHQILNAKFVHINLTECRCGDVSKYLKIRWDELNEFAMPRLITRYLESYR